MTGENTGPLAQQAAQNAGDAAGTGDGAGGEQPGSLLECDADDLDGGDGTGDGEGTGGEGGSGEGGDGDEGSGSGERVDVNGIVDALEKRLADRFDAVADRRVNALLKEIRKQGGGQQNDDGGSGEGEQQNQPSQTGTQDQSGLVRATRLAAREYLTDEVRFISAEERKFAMDMVTTLVAAKVASGVDDEDVAGHDVAKQVADQVKALRSHYESRTVAALKKRGALKETPGQPQKQGGGVSSQSQFDKGAEIAARIRPTTTTKE